MASYVEAINAISIERSSPSGLTHVRVVRQNETIVKLDPRARSQYDEDFVAQELEEIVPDAWDAMSHEHDQLRQTLGMRMHDPDAVPEWWRDVHEEIATLECSAKSARGLVEVFLTGADDIFVQFAPNAVRRTDIDVTVLEMEINEAIRNARFALMQNIKVIYRRVSLANR